MKPATTFGQIFGQLLVHLRGRQARHQGELAAAVGLSQSAYSRLERGEAAFSLPQLRRVATALHVSLDDLFRQADVVTERLRQQGVEVLDDRPRDERGGAGWLWVAIGVVAGAVALSGADDSSPKKKAKGKRKA